MPSGPIALSEPRLTDARVVVGFALELARLDLKASGPAVLPNAIRKRAWVKKLDDLHIAVVFGPQVGTWRDADGNELPGERAYVSEKNLLVLQTVVDSVIESQTINSAADGEEELLATGLGLAAIRLRDYLKAFD